MKSIYDVINEAKELESVYTVNGPDGSIVSVWPTEQEAKDDLEKQNKEAGGKVFTIEKHKTDEFVKFDK